MKRDSYGQDDPLTTKIKCEKADEGESRSCCNEGKGNEHSALEKCLRFGKK